MMKYYLPIVSVLSLTILVVTCWAQTPFPHVVFQQDPNGMPNERIWTDDIQIGSDLVLHATIKVTAKGNGSLTVDGVGLGQVYDDHDEGVTFEGSLADIVFRDINNDGFNDVVVSGIINVNHDKTGEVLDRRAFVRIHLYDREHQTFTMAYDSTTKSE